MNWLLSNLANIGLILDIIGALLIFFGSPKVNYQTYFYNQDKLKELDKKSRRINKTAKIGAFILFVGFLLQLIGYNMNP